MPAPKLRLKNGRFATIQQLLDSLQHPGALLTKIGEFLKASTKERIKTTKTAPDGTPWAAWAPATALARERNGTSSLGLLFQTGALYDSIDYQVQARSVIVGAGVAYAQFLQQGTANMPARPFVGFSENDKSSINSIVRAFLKTDK